jgi:hypothetical protein
VPIARRSAIHPTVIVVSARKRAAKTTFTQSPLGPSFEIHFLPPPQLQLLRDDEFRQHLCRLRALLAVMLRPHPLTHLRQQLLPKLLLAQTPTAPNRLELLAFLRPAPFLYISISRTDPFTR